METEVCSPLVIYQIFNRFRRFISLHVHTYVYRRLTSFLPRTTGTPLTFSVVFEETVEGLYFRHTCVSVQTHTAVDTPGDRRFIEEMVSKPWTLRR